MVIVSRPPALFPPLDTFDLGADPLVFNYTIPDLNLESLEQQQLGRQVVPSLSISGLMWALAVPILSALINILTRQVGDPFDKTKS